jgi:hypothetical protein
MYKIIVHYGKEFDYEKAMTGYSNKYFFLKRADGWWKSVLEFCESLLEQSMEHLNWVSNYFRLKAVIVISGRCFSYAFN